jgi:hypothetical protein
LRTEIRMSKTEPIKLMATFSDSGRIHISGTDTRTGEVLGEVLLTELEYKRLTTTKPTEDVTKQITRPLKTREMRTVIEWLLAGKK